MSKGAKEIILRIQSPDGTKRFAVHSSNSISSLLNKVEKEFQLSNGWKLYQNKERSVVITTSKKSIDSLNIRHGDMLYLVPGNISSGESGGGLANSSSSAAFPRVPSTSSVGMNKVASTSSIGGLLRVSSNAALGASDTGSVTSGNQMDIDMSVVEDEIDVILEQTDGKIYRSRDEKYCKHGPKAKCIHCSAVEPYDEQYLLNREPPIKHMSFHAYLRKLMRGVDKGKFAPLENITCSIKPGCMEHPPWPNGICTKCQPNALTLNRQTYRHVDNISFENKFLVERFLNYWRTTGNQRLGFLYGRYEPHKDVPLGIRATVCAIYEPPQESSRDHVQMLPDSKEESVDWLASQLGLQRVGWIITDLIPEDTAKGTVKYTRHSETIFLSAEECITAAQFQNLHPNVCRYAPGATFGSKFVTVIVTGDVEQQIHFESYQVSNQCMALVSDACLLPTRDTPELCYVKPSTNEQYVPDVFFKKKNEYGTEVTHTARVFPVDYLLVDVPTSVPVDQQFTFITDNNIEHAFPIENRLIAGEMQDFTALCNYFHTRNLSYRDVFYDSICDFHLLVYLCDLDLHPMKEHMLPLLEAVKEKDADRAYQWSECESWCTLVEIMKAHAPSPPSKESIYPAGAAGAAGSSSAGGAAGSSSAGGAAASSGATAGGTSSQPGATIPWPCKHCTFHNQPSTDTCEVCGLPRY